MAELYLQQGFTQEALQVYRQLLAQNPRDDALRERIAALEKGSRSSVGVAAVSDKVFDEVQRRHRHEPETIRAFFAALMRRRVLQRYDDSARAGHTRPESTSPNGDGSVWGTGTEGGSSRADESHKSAEGGDGSSELAFIVPAGAAPPPGMAPGDENRAEYRDEIAGATSSRALAGIPVLTDESPRTSIHDAPTETYETPPPAYQPPANHGVAATSREAYRDEYAQPASSAQPEATQPAAAEELGSISLLFGEAGVEGNDEQAAKVLSGAFPVVEGKSLAGRPAERAKNELSLDNVFREADRKTGRNSGGFSFDQFFSDGSGGAK
jgi:hypothetical protein